MSLRFRFSLLLCFAASFLALSGCSSYVSHMKVGEKRAEGRSLSDIYKNRTEVLADLRNALASILKPQDATDAAKNSILEKYGKLRELAIEEKVAKKNTTPEEDKAVDAKYRANIESSRNDIDSAYNQIKSIRPPPEAFIKAIDDAQAELKTAETTEIAAGGDVQIVATDPSVAKLGSTWAMWVLGLLVIATCVGFLFREGIWSNVVRLVNVVFAGLLAMNFYEPLAKFAANYQDDLRTFTAFWDFLAFWICFIASAAVLAVITDNVSRVRVRFLQIAEKYGSPVVALGVGWVMTGIVFTSMHLAPLGEYPLLGCFQPQASMFFGMLAPDREWLGFTKYQSQNGFCRSAKVSDDFFRKHVAFSDFGNENFIDKNWKRRIELEKYVRGNVEHSPRVNKQFIKGR